MWAVIIGTFIVTCGACGWVIGQVVADVTSPYGRKGGDE